MQVRQSVRGIRIGAAIIDMVVVGTINTIIRNIIFSNIISQIEAYSIIGDVISIITSLTFYSILPFLNNGATIGKSLVGIKVLSADYNKASLFQLIIRNVFFISALFLFFMNLFSEIKLSHELDTELLQEIFALGLLYLLIGFIFFILYVIIFIMILSSREERGLHDLIASTIVVDKNFHPETLKSGSSLNNTDSYWEVTNRPQ